MLFGAARGLPVYVMSGNRFSSSRPVRSLIRIILLVLFGKVVGVRPRRPIL